MKQQISLRVFVTMYENKIWDLANCQSQKNNSNLPKSSTITSMLQIAMYTYNDVKRTGTLFAQYKQPKYRDLSTNNTRRYWSWILLWQNYLSPSDIGMYFSVNTMHKISHGIAMKVWKSAFHSIPFWHLLYSMPKFPFHSISYHALVVDSILLLPHFTSTVVPSFRVWKFGSAWLWKNCLYFYLIFNTFASEFASASNLFHQSASASTKNWLLPLPASASTSLVVVMDPIMWSQFLLKVW